MVGLTRARHLRRELEAGGAVTKFDVGAVNFEIAGYFGKHFSKRRAIEAESADLLGLSAGTQHITTTSRTALAFRYWFSEKVGLTLPLYAEMVKDDLSGKTMSQGGGLYGTFRFESGKYRIRFATTAGPFWSGGFIVFRSGAWRLSHDDTESGRNDRASRQSLRL